MSHLHNYNNNNTDENNQLSNIKDDNQICTKTNQLLSINSLNLSNFTNGNCDNQTNQLQDYKKNYGTTATVESHLRTPSIYTIHGQHHPEVRGHCHKERPEGVDVKARKKLIIASILCVLFMIAEAVGGILSNSLAIATDAAHLLTDFASFMISLFAIWIAGRPSTQRMSFGWHRAEVIGALASVIMIWVITGILVYLAIQRVINNAYEVDAKVMLITSALAILVNLIIGFQLGHGHSHGGQGHSHGGHGHSHGPTHETVSKETSEYQTVIDSEMSISDKSEALETVITTIPIPDIKSQNYNEMIQVSIRNKKEDAVSTVSSKTVQMLTGSDVALKEIPCATEDGRNMNVRAAFIHVIGDFVQSIGVFLAAILIYFRPDWAIADPICTFIFSIIVLSTTFAIMKDALLVLMEATPANFPYTEVVQCLNNIDGVERVHNVRIWALSVNKIALSAHLVIRPGANPKNILRDADTAVHRKYNFFETTIQIEDFTPDMDDCQQCRVPEN